MTSFEKKRSKNEKRTHKNKRRKRDKRVIEKSVIRKMLEPSSEIISDEFSLSFARTIIISERSSSIAPQLEFDDRVRQLSNELKEVRRQYQMKRMKELIQSRHHSVNETTRDEYDLDTSDRIMREKIISFTFINTASREIYEFGPSLASTQQSIRSVLNNNSTVFDLEEFLSELEKIIFSSEENIEKEIPIRQVRTDSESKRLVLTSFNEEETIMRRVMKYDSHENKISIKDSRYKVYRKASLKTKNVIYRSE
jgi:hypothetical protein